ncbi:MAG: tRNA (adenosine(37)-N6)-threonylcarbamoyltransferase complex ATPase subunit type 1 TsaE [Oscillospiraceae bacterium]|nr:tRNA (adenosine(37)-N6)-threonylcarbamoyltransferase complex ATPase subunit type 1 TsaE [Oscillospiraceae bacterium]
MTNRASRSEIETMEIAAELAKTLHPGDIVALFGGLGMGKTAFVRGLASGLGLDSTQVCSPTFALMNEYRRPGAPTLYHFDMYRVQGDDTLYATGFYDYLDSDGILAIEWSENIVHALPKGGVRVDIALGESEGQRVITIGNC